MPTVCSLDSTPSLVSVTSPLKIKDAEDASITSRLDGLVKEATSLKYKVENLAYALEERSKTIKVQNEQLSIQAGEIAKLKAELRVEKDKSQRAYDRGFERAKIDTKRDLRDRTDKISKAVQKVQHELNEDRTQLVRELKEYKTLAAETKHEKSKYKSLYDELLRMYVGKELEIRESKHRYTVAIQLYTDRGRQIRDWKKRYEEARGGLYSIDEESIPQATIYRKRGQELGSDFF